MLGFGPPPRHPGSVGVGALMKDTGYNAGVWSNGDRLFEKTQVDVVDTDVPGNSLTFDYLSGAGTPKYPPIPGAELSSFTMTFETAQILNLSWPRNVPAKVVKDELSASGAINPVSGRLEKDVFIVTEMLVADNVHVTCTFTGKRTQVSFEPQIGSLLVCNLLYFSVCMLYRQSLLEMVPVMLLMNAFYMASVARLQRDYFEHTTPTSVTWGEKIIGWKLAKLEFHGNRVILNKCWTDTRWKRRPENGAA